MRCSSSTLILIIFKVLLSAKKELLKNLIKTNNIEYPNNTQKLILLGVVDYGEKIQRRSPMPYIPPNIVAQAREMDPR